MSRDSLASFLFLEYILIEMKRNLELLYEVGSLRNLKRTWSQFLGQGVENVSEHILRVIWLALCICRLEKKGDEEKIIKIALVHDLCESRTGDTNYIHSLYTKTEDLKAVNDSLKGTVFEKDLNSLFKEYKERSSIEAKIVKDADILEVDMELAEIEEKGSNLRKDWKQYRDKIAQNLYTKTARKLYQEIQKLKPIEWLISARAGREIK
jgi:putative hydrolase of HD superfamily